jgi:hypothetical protein
MHRSHLALSGQPSSCQPLLRTDMLQLARIFLPLSPDFLFIHCFHASSYFFSCLIILTGTRFRAKHPARALCVIWIPSLSRFPAASPVLARAYNPHFNVTATSIGRDRTLAMKLPQVPSGACVLFSSSCLRITLHAAASEELRFVPSASGQNPLFSTLHGTHLFLFSRV